MEPSNSGLLKAIFMAVRIDISLITNKRRNPRNCTDTILSAETNVAGRRSSACLPSVDSNRKWMKRREFRLLCL